MKTHISHHDAARPSNRPWQALARATMTMALTLSAVAQAAAVTPTNVLTLKIVVRDRANIPPAILDEAQKVAGWIYRGIGVETIWLKDGSAELSRAVNADPRGEQAFFASSIQITLLPAGGSDWLHLGPGALGAAAPYSRFSWVLWDRVQDLLGDRQQDLGTLLGSVMAHEIGHLLLPPNSHSVTGIMRATMNVELAVQNCLRFDPRQATMIRTQMTALLSGRALGL